MTANDFDQKAIRRSGKALKAYLLELNPREDTHKLRERILPIVNDALAGRLELPFDDRNEPLRHEATIGLLPKDYMRVSAAFWLYITGGLGPDVS